MTTQKTFFADVFYILFIIKMFVYYNLEIFYLKLEEARGLLRRFESQARQQQQDLEYKNNELETVRKELAELWSTHNQLTEHSGQQADLIRQIQSLQTDTQKSKILNIYPTMSVNPLPGNFLNGIIHVSTFWNCRYHFREIKIRACNWSANSTV